MTHERTAAFLACVASAVIADGDLDIYLWCTEDEARQIAPMIAKLVDGEVDRREQPSGVGYYFVAEGHRRPKAYVVLYVRAGPSKCESAMAEPPEVAA